MTMLNVSRFATIALSLCTLSIVAQDSDRFENAPAGFSLSKPPGWSFVPREELTRNRTKAEVSAEELQKALALEQPVTIPLVALEKDEKWSFGNFQVTLIPRKASVAHASPKQVLEFLVLPNLQKGFPDLKIESPARELELAGHPAADYVATRTIRTSQASMPVRLRAILVPHGKFFFLIDMTAPVEGYEQTRKEFETMLSSITIR